MVALHKQRDANIRKNRPNKDSESNALLSCKSYRFSENPNLMLKTMDI